MGGLRQILRIPYHFVFNRYTDAFQPFGLMMSEYQPLQPDGMGIWLKEAELGLGLWQGGYQGGIDRGCDGMTVRGSGYPHRLS